MKEAMGREVREAHRREGSRSRVMSVPMSRTGLTFTRRHVGQYDPGREFFSGPSIKLGLWRVIDYFVGKQKHRATTLTFRFERTNQDHNKFMTRVKTLCICVCVCLCMY